MKIVALVPIKMNSERLPHKNILPLGEKPLCCHLFDTLTQVSKLDEVYVFCSDPQIKRFISSPLLYLEREKVLDGSLVKANALYESFLKKVDADIYVVVHTTAPFIKAETISNALEHVASGEYDSAFAVQRCQTFAWYQGAPLNYDPTNIPRTQDMEPVYLETSGFFIFKKEVFAQHHRRIGLHPYMQEVSAIEAIDIDTAEDYEFAQKICILKTMGKEV